MRQTPRGVDVDVVARAGLDVDALAGRLAAALDGAGLDGAQVDIRRVDGFARHAETGKLARFVPLR